MTKDAPERIWAFYSEVFGTAWFSHVDDGATEYLRADVAAAREDDLRAEVERLSEEVLVQSELHIAAIGEATRLRALLDEARPVLEEAAAVAHRAFVAANMEAANAGPTHPLKRQLDAWRVRCLNADQRARATLAVATIPPHVAAARVLLERGGAGIFGMFQDRALPTSWSEIDLLARDWLEQIAKEGE